jgi:hypothetical protein
MSGTFNVVGICTNGKHTTGSVIINVCVVRLEICITIEACYGNWTP